MTSRIKKLSILIIAAVMLVAMAFAGAASATIGITIYNATDSKTLNTANDVMYSDDGQGTATLTHGGSGIDPWILELNNFNVTRSEVSIISSFVPNLTINLVGESNLTGSYADYSKGLLYAEGNLTITDSGKLLVNNTNSSSQTVNSIYVKKEFTINDAKVTAIANNGGKGASAISGIEKLTITGSNTVVEANATSITDQAISIGSSLDVKIDSSAKVTANAQGKTKTASLCSDSSNVSIKSNAVVEANANSTTDKAYSIYAGNDIEIDSSAKVTAKAQGSTTTYALCSTGGNVSIESNAVVEANATSTSEIGCGIYGIIDVKINSSAKVTAKAQGSSYTYALYSMRGNVSIGSSAIVEANATSTSDIATSIYANQTLEITSSTKVKATAKTAGSGNSANVLGLYAGYGNITIANSLDVIVNVTGNAGKVCAILLDNKDKGDLEISISNSEVTANATTASGVIYSICADPGNITISDSAKITVNANSNTGKVYGLLADKNDDDLGVLTIDSSTVDASVNSNGKASVTICGLNELNILDSEVKSEATGLSDSQDPASATTAIASLSSQKGLVTIDSSTVTIDVLETNTDPSKGVAVGIYANESLNINNSEIDVDVGPTGYMNGGFMLSSYTNKINISGDDTKISVNVSAPSMIGIGFFSYNGFTIENCTRIFANGSKTSFGYLPIGSHNITALSSGYSFHNASLTSTEEPCSYTRFNDDWTTITSPMPAKLSNYSKVLITKEDTPTPTPTPTPSPSSGGSSSKHSGYTQILSQGQVAPTPYATTTPTAAPTAAPTPVVNPTAKPTTQATTQPTQSSPAPVAGLIAGLGVAALVLARLRK